MSASELNLRRRPVMTRVTAN